MKKKEKISNLEKKETKKLYINHSEKDLLEEFDSNKDEGLTSSEAKKRLEKYGPNRMQETKRRNIFLRFLDQFKDFMILILIIAAILSFVTKDYAEGGLVLAIILLNAIIGLIQEEKAEKALQAIQKMSSPHAKVLRDGVEQVIDASEVVPGDIVILEAGDNVSADMRLIESVNLKIDESALTGEAVPVDKKAIILENEEVALGDRINSAYMSTIVTYGRGVGIVTETGMDTEIGDIAKMIHEAKTDQTPLQKSIAQLGKILALIALAITFVIFAINIGEHYIFDEGAVTWQVWKDSLMTSVALAVAAIPEGLPAIITIILALGMQNLARHKAIMKNLPAVETLGSTSVICSDKTGTLTQNVMTVTDLHVEGKTFKVSDIETMSPTLKNVISYGVLCNDTKVNKDDDGKYNTIGDPTEIAFVDLAIALDKNPIDILNKYPRVFELPFDSERKLMTTVHDFEDGRYAVIKGAPDVMLKRSNLSDEEISKYEMANLEMTSRALRVLAVGYKKLDDNMDLDLMNHETLEYNIEIIGLVGMIDPPRPEVKDAIKTTYDAKMQVIMITGDHKNTALAIAKDLNIIKDDSDKAISGLELDNMTDEEFERELEHIKVYARVSPENKVRIVNAWKEKGNIVAMTGDGVNDAPALKSANIGIAMGITGTEVSKSAAEMILTDDNFTTIVTAVEEGRGIYANIRKAIHFLLSCNIGEIITIFLGTVLGALIFKDSIITLTAVQILWVNLVTDSLMALAMGVEPPESDIMKEPPRDAEKSFFADGLGLKIAWQGILIGVLSFIAFIIGYHTSIHFHPGHTDQTMHLQNASAMTFMVLSISQLFHAFNVRSEHKSIFKLKINKWLIGAFVISFLLQILTIVFPFSRKLFGIDKLNVYEWLIVFGLALIPVMVSEIQKLISNRKRKYKLSNRRNPNDRNIIDIAKNQ